MAIRGSVGYWINKGGGTGEHNVLAYGATGDGVTNDLSAIQSAVSASANQVLYFPPGTYLIDGNLTIGSNVKVEMSNGAIIRPTFGRVLTINGNFNAGLHQVFSWFSGVYNRSTSTDDGLFNGVGGWTVGTGWSIGGGVATHTTGNTGTLSYANCAGVNGKTFVVKYTVGGTPNGGIIPSIGGVSGYRRTTAGTYVDLITATGTGALTFTPETNFGGTLDNVEVYMLGTHVLGLGSVEEVLPQWWGARGDDSTECYLAFHYALEATKTIGRLSVPPGTYRVGFPVNNFPRNYNSTISSAIMVYGASQSSSIIKYTGTGNRFAIELSSDRPAILGGTSPYNAMVCSHITLENLHVQANSTSSMGGGILLAGTYNVKLNNIGIRQVDNGIGIFSRDAAFDQRSTGRVNNTDRKFTSNGKYAIAFTPLSNASGRFRSATVRLKRTGSPAGTIRAVVYSDSSGVPGSAVTGVASDPVNCSSLSTNSDGAEQKFEFNVSDGLTNVPSVNSGTQYWLVLETDGYTYTDGVTEVIIRTRSSDNPGKFAIYDGSSWSSADDGADISIETRTFQSGLPHVRNSFIGGKDTGSGVNVGIRIEDLSQVNLQTCYIRARNGIISRGGSLLWAHGCEFSQDTDKKTLELFMPNGQSRFTQCWIENGSVEFKGGRHYFVNTHNSFNPQWSDSAFVYVDRSCNLWLPRNVDDPTHVFNADWIILPTDSRLQFFTSASVTNDADALIGQCIQLPVQNSMVRLDFSSSRITWMLNRGVYLCTVYAKDTNNVANDATFGSGHLNTGGTPQYTWNNSYTLTGSYRPYRVLMYVTSSIAPIGRGLFFRFSKATATSNTIYISHFMIQRLGNIGLDTLYVNDLIAHNTEMSNADGSRESNVYFIGRKADGAQHNLAVIRALHDGTSNDEKGRIEFLINDGDDKFNPTKMATLSSSGLAIGASGSAIKQIATGTISIDPPSISANSQGTVTFTLTGAVVGDRVIMEPPTDLNSGLVFKGARVTASNTVTIYLHNVTGSAIDDTSKSWNYTWMDLT